MSEEKMKKALDHLLGLESGKPDKEIDQAVGKLKKLNQQPKMSEEMKKRGWEEIQRKKLGNDVNEVYDSGSIPRPSKKLILFPLISAAAAAMVILAATWMFYGLIKPGKITAEIVASSGPVIVNGAIVDLPVSVGENDVLESPDGNYRMIINKEIVLNVEYKSKLWFSRIDKNLVVSLEEGGIAAVVKSTKHRPDQMVYFKTPTGNVNVKGTIFYLRVMSPDETYFCICHGDVVLEAGQQQVEAKAVHHGGYSMLRVDTLSGKEEKIVPDTMKYHQDPLLEEMAREINYPVRWDK